MAGPKNTRVMVVGASADSSILDVQTGWVEALQRANYHAYTYSLNNRIKLWTEVLGELRHGLSCGHCGGRIKEANPEFENAGQATIIQAASDCLVHEALRHRADWVVVISGCSLNPDSVALLHHAGIPVVTILTECPYNDADMRDLASVSTIVGVNDLASVDYFERVVLKRGGRVLYLPTGWTSGVHEPVEGDPAMASDVFFCGTGFDERGDLFSDVDWEALGVNFRLAGFWPIDSSETVVPTDEERRMGQVAIGAFPGLQKYLAAGLVPNRDLPSWYSQAKIVLSVHRRVDEDARSLSIGPRVYEAAACGAFQLCDDSRPELTEVFGDSVPTFRAWDPGDLEDKVLYYLKDDLARKQMATEARTRAAGHSYDDRLKSLVSFINASPG